MAGQRWVRLDVDYFHNPKILAAGRDGRDLHLASICWVGRYLTDGHIPGDVISSLLDDAGVAGKARNRATEAVTVAGLWLPTENDFYLKDFIEMNGTRADAERAREMNRQRQRKYKQREG